jgi:phage anti-repressor protein
MNELIKVSKTVIGTKEVNAVSARELYIGLGLTENNWVRWSDENLVLILPISS